MNIEISIDRPRPGVPLRSYAGFLEVTGWAAATEPITELGVSVPGGEWQRAVYCQPRPDVAAVHPKLAHAARSGFRVFVKAPPSVGRLEVRAVAGRKAKAREVGVFVSPDVREITVEYTPERRCSWCGHQGPKIPSVQHGPFQLVACAACEFAFAEPLPTADDLARIYEIEYWQNAVAGPDVVGVSADTDFIARLISEFGNGGRRVLEVGCGQGTLVHGLMRLGYQVTGQDLSRNAAVTLEKTYGILVHRGPLAGMSEHCYDCIVTRHVIEHSVTPLADLRWMRAHLNERGIVVLLTPNRRSLAAEVLGETWEWFVPPIHVGYFSSKVLELAEPKAGLRLRRLTTREGDGASLVDTLRAFLDYEGARLPEWRRARCMELYRLAADVGQFEGWMHRGAAAAGLGQELIAVFEAC